MSAQYFRAINRQAIDILLRNSRPMALGMAKNTRMHLNTKTRTGKGKGIHWPNSATMLKTWRTMPAHQITETISLTSFGHYWPPVWGKTLTSVNNMLKIKKTYIEECLDWVWRTWWCHLISHSLNMHSPTHLYFKWKWSEVLMCYHADRSHPCFEA